MIFSFLVLIGLYAGGPAASDSLVVPFEQSLSMHKAQEIQNFPSPHGTLHVQLKPLQIWHDEAVLEVFHKEGRAKQTVHARNRFMHGVTKDGVLVFVSRTKEGGLRGFTRGQAGTWGFRTQDGHLVYSKASGRAFECRTAEFAEVVPMRTVPQPRLGKTDLNDAIVDIALETDTALYQEFEDVEMMKDAVSESMAAISAIYQRDFGAELRIVYLSAYPEEDPWENSTITELQNHWLDPNNGKSGISRTLTHLLSAVSFYGVGFIDTMCNVTWGYGRSSFYGLYVADNTDFSDINLVAHELGHNFGSPHTHDYTPTIDRCPTFTGVLPTEGGTLMSYCHFQTATIELSEFHPRVQEWVRGRIEVRDCIPRRLSSIEFSDDAFKAALVEAHDSNEDGEINHDEAEQITALQLNDLGIENLDGIRYFVNLETLNADNNAITMIPLLLPATLKELSMVNNPLAKANCDRLISLEKRGLESLTLEPYAETADLDCTTDAITFADANLQTAVLAAGDTDEDGTLTHAEASLLTSLDLTGLEIADLSGIDQLPNLVTLIAADNGLTELPTFPPKLANIDISGNALTNLDAVSVLPNLSVLVASNNEISALPTLNTFDFLDSLYVSSNQLTELPSLRNVNGKNTLYDVDVSNNQISELPDLPRVIFALNVAGNNLTEIPEIPALNYTFSQWVDISGNRLADTAESCALIASFLERDMGQFLFEPQQDVTRFDCANIEGAMPALSQVLPWVVNNENYQSSLTITNNGPEAGDVVLRAISAAGEAKETLTLAAGEQRTVNASELFPNMDRYTLAAHANQFGLATETVLRNVNGPSAGAGGTVQGHAYNQLSGSVVMTGLTGTAVAVLSTPGNRAETPITVSLHGPSGTLIAEKVFTARGEAPLPLVIPQEFPEAAGLGAVAIRARVAEGLRLCGTAFYFEGWAEFGTAQGISFFQPPFYALALLPAERQGAEIHLFNPERQEVSAFFQVIDDRTEEADFVRHIIPAGGTLVFHPDRELTTEGPAALWVFTSRGSFSTLKLRDQVGSGAPSVAAANLIDPNRLSREGYVRYDRLEAAENVLHLIPLFGSEEGQTITLNLTDAAGTVVESKEIEMIMSYALELVFSETFETTDLSGLYLEMSTTAEEEVFATSLRQYDENGRSLLRKPAR
ncbi:M12 family metallo-peptidase [Acanthopleuribacter pedis]|uniref:Peptidase M12B domain-containing protein n=1 Tax=Acanthopleuribacter pedis TaxID=442870 RepID=A0A8J7QAT4_9BACT|nr:M12 family metallo-peptidase [Acanthopleuribacter pedis]MBO1320760.1 hypothetical protein [Acanthopleuribacter pedis]